MKNTLKKYNVTITGASNAHTTKYESFQVSAMNLRDAREIAQFRKRHTCTFTLKGRGCVSVRLAK